MNSAVNSRLNMSDVTPATATHLRLSPVPVSRFDEYVVVARLGHGGMAEVILGLTQGPAGFRKLVAIKRLHAHCEEDAELVQMFLHEAKLAALFSHPNVVQTYKVGCADGRHFIAMEYLEGQPLQRILPRLISPGAGVDPALCARIAMDALAGLEHAHEARDFDGVPLELVHRDVSPQNLFITFDGQVKLLDFGIAKAARYGVHTRQGLIKGKLSYLAPEQARGLADRRADVWSVGVILWEALAGRRLFRGENEVEVLRGVLSAEIPPLPQVASNVPESLAAVVGRALERERDARYASAREMRDDLARFLSEQGETASRNALARAMQLHFADAMRERREAVRECCAAVEQEERWRELAAPSPREEVPEPITLVPEAPGPRRGKRRAALLAALALAGGFGLSQALSAHMPAASELQAASASPRAAARREAAGALGQAESPAPGSAAPIAALPQRALPDDAALNARFRVALEPGEGAASAALTAREELRAKRARPRAASATLEQASESAPAELAPSPPASAPAPAAATGRLRLESTPYAVVSLDGKRLGITPIDVELPVAAHTLVLRNPERAIETTYRVQIVSGESLSRRVELE